MNYLVGVDLKFLDTATMAWGEEILKKGMKTDILRGLLHEPEPPPLHHLPDRCKIWSLTNHKSVLHL